MTVKNFKNMLGQIIRPGEHVIIISSARAGKVNISKGIYLEERGGTSVVCLVNAGNYWRRTYLPSGRIFLLNTPLSDTNTL
jgi:hypothetical protein